MIGSGRKVVRPRYMDLARYSAMGAPVCNIHDASIVSHGGGVEMKTAATAHQQPVIKLPPNVDEYIRRGYSGGVTRVLNNSWELKPVQVVDSMLAICTAASMKADAVVEDRSVDILVNAKRKVPTPSKMHHRVEDVLADAAQSRLKKHLDAFTVLPREVERYIHDDTYNNKSGRPDCAMHYWSVYASEHMSTQARDELVSIVQVLDVEEAISIVVNSPTTRPLVG